jgi:2-polyprenyl-6-methoxyphenol hydroxylase-like FAD-dependent oxidoreductase
MKVIGMVDHPNCIDVMVAGKCGRMSVRARLLVGADGSRSQIRKLAGFVCRRESLSMVSMATVPSSALPDSDCAHLFVDGERIAFAYPIDGMRARVMVDHASGTAPSPQEIIDLLPAACPTSIRRALCNQREDQGLRRFLTSLVSVDHACCGHTVLVGDASGTCHPLTASGMTAATSDALSLAKAIAEMPDDLGIAATSHAARRKSRQLTRLALATLLHEIYTDSTPRSTALRRAMMSDWGSVAGQVHGISLLSMTEDRPHQLLRSMTRILYRGLAHLHTPDAPLGLAGEFLAGVRASKTVFRYGTALLTNSYRLLGGNGRDTA